MKKKQKNKSQESFVIKFENGAEIHFQMPKQNDSVRGLNFNFLDFYFGDEEIEDNRKEEINE